MQERAGKRQMAETIGQRVIRPFMPDQHRSFYAQLPFIVIGSVDCYGWPWASMLTGGTGFITSPHDQRLDLTATPLADDPLASNIKPDAPLGLLGIELSTRRRNRMNATVHATSANGLSLDVVQSFGNCPQYIQTRDIQFVRGAGDTVARTSSERFVELDADAQAFIAQADSFYVASSSAGRANPMANGADVSHRGGQSGFLKVTGNSILVPDFSGNNFFNTLGNFLMTAKAGLLFPDYATGNVLMLTGTTEVLAPQAPEIAGFQGAERAWRFTLNRGIRIYDALPFRADFTQWSANSLKTGTWEVPDRRRTN